MNDTDKKIEDIYKEMLRKKTGEERLRMGFSMFQFAGTILLSSLKNKISSDTDIATINKDLRKNIFLKIYGSDFEKKELEKILEVISELQP